MEDNQGIVNQGIDNQNKDKYPKFLAMVLGCLAIICGILLIVLVKAFDKLDNSWFIAGIPITAVGIVMLIGVFLDK